MFTLRENNVILGKECVKIEVDADQLFDCIFDGVVEFFICPGFALDVDILKGTILIQSIEVPSFYSQVFEFVCGKRAPGGYILKFKLL